jgi:hypothetical protein
VETTVEMSRATLAALRKVGGNLFIWLDGLAPPVAHFDALLDPPESSGAVFDAIVDNITRP